MAGIISPKMTPVPLGRIRPRGWLEKQVDLQISGFFGHLTDISRFLTDDNGWLNYNRTLDEHRAASAESADRPYQAFAWEEQAYWLRGAYRLALVSGDKKLTETALKYIGALLDSVCEDGWFGPVILRDVEPGAEKPIADIWPHMVMMDVLKDYYLETGDGRALDALTGFVRFCLAIPDDTFMPGWDKLKSGMWFASIQSARVCEPAATLNWLAEETGSDEPVRLSRRLYAVYEKMPAPDLDRHVVNFAQRIKYPATHYAVSGDRADLERAEKHYLDHMAAWGQMPGGLYAADENTREGKHDPRQGTETCAMSEIVNSFLCMAQYSGNTVYADRAEDIMFNSYPASHTPDYGGLHYLTADNLPLLDDGIHDYSNRSCQTRYDAGLYRCCQHNTGMAWPNFISSLLMTGENALTAWAYAPCEAEVIVSGSPVSLREETGYPFKNNVRFALKAEKAFAFRMRIPGWAKGFTLTVNGAPREAQAEGGLIALPIEAGDTTVELVLNREIGFRFFKQNNDCVCVDYGALTFSLKLDERWIEAGSFTDRAGVEWKKWDVKTASPFNYALSLDKPVRIKFEADEVPPQPFTRNSAPVVLEAAARRAPQWGMDELNTVMPVPADPVCAEEEESVELVPLGCMRARMSCLPHTGTWPGRRS